MKYRDIPSKRIAHGLCLVLACSLFPASNASTDPLPAFSASYKVHYGLLRGEMTLELRPDGESAYTYNTALRPRGLVSIFRSGSIEESTSLELGDGVLMPGVYRSVDTIARPSREIEYRFDQPRGRVTGTYKGRAIDEPMRAGGHNRISAHVAVMLALNLGRELSGIAVFDRARWRDFEFQTIPGQEVSTKLGDFEAIEIRYTSTRKNRSWSLHCAPALDYVPVMIAFRQDGKLKSRAVLVEYQPLDEGKQVSGEKRTPGL